MKSIAFLLPGHGHNVPIGGYKVVFEYANRFAENNFNVYIYYIVDPNLKCESLWKHLYKLLLYIYMILRGYSGRKWFNLNKSIKEKCLLFLNKKTVLSADCCVATAAWTAININRLKVKGKNLVYFIQGYETWDVGRDELHESYHFDMKKIVISSELKNILKQENVICSYIPNGFDFIKFHYDIPIEKRCPFSVSMLFHHKELKGCQYGFEALEIVKKVYPELKVTLFGTPQRPSWLPQNYIYFQQPDDMQHNSINNNSAIFISPSLSEGWGLTVGEAMICGQAVACTSIGGHLEIAKNEVNALLSSPQNSNEMAENIIRLIKDPELRYNLAKKGMESIKKYTWDYSFEKFKNVCFN